MTKPTSRKAGEEFLLSLARQFDGIHPSADPKRYARSILTHEPVALPPGDFMIRVLEGKARIKYASEDLILSAGETKLVKQAICDVVVAPAKEGDFLRFTVLTLTYREPTSN